ncbi:amidase signature domain-containing protein [Nemania sp. NC0429]|nr:amidase signature domain-containing protein [Nemania sp. NC0429]
MLFWSKFPGKLLQAPTNYFISARLLDISLAILILLFVLIFLITTLSISSMVVHKMAARSERPKSAALANINLLTVTGAELQDLLRDGQVLSTQLIELYLAQIEKHNHDGLKLNAMICTTPREVLIRIAKKLDQERIEGTVRGRLHGIPITVKDNIMTGSELGMPTTVGTFALEKAMARRNAPIVDKLIEAGAIIIGKANLSEMTGWKGFGLTTGWSALGGQTQSPYIDGGFKDGDKLLGHSAPGGSSSGSAAGVAAGFAPLALATETDGSIVQPSNRAALYGLKATVGLLSTEGTAPWSSLTDSIGGMAKSSEDLMSLIEALSGKNYREYQKTSWDGLRIGFVDPNLWSFSPVICDPDEYFIQQQRIAIADAMDQIKKNGGIVKGPVPLTSMEELLLDGDDALEQLWNHDFEKEWNLFLQDYESKGVETLKDIVHFNFEHPAKALPPRYQGQQLLEAAIDEKQKISDEKYAEGVEIIRNAAKNNGIDKTLTEYDLDIIAGPMDGRIPTIAAAAGYPVGTMPLGYSKSNGRPFGMCVVASEWQEGKILQAMSAWEAMVEKRKPPPQMINGPDEKDRSLHDTISEREKFHSCQLTWHFKVQAFVSALKPTVVVAGWKSKMKQGARKLRGHTSH